MLVKTLAITTLSALFILFALLQQTSPSTIHPLGILLIFFLMYVLALGVLTFFIYGLGMLVARLQKKQDRAITFKKSYYFASVLALAPVMMIGMKSIGRTSGYDVLLIILFELVACFYIYKRQ